MNPNEKWAGTVTQAFRLVLDPDNNDDVCHSVDWRNDRRWPTIHAPLFFILADRRADPLKLYRQAVTRQSLLVNGDTCYRTALAIVGTDLGDVVMIGLKPFLNLVKRATEDLVELTEED